MADGQTGRIGAHALRVWMPYETAPGHVQILRLRLVASNAADTQARWRFVLKTVPVSTLLEKHSYAGNGSVIKLYLIGKVGLYSTWEFNI